MTEPDTYRSIPAAQLTAEVRTLGQQHWRLVQIGATPLADTIELNYSFDQAGRFLNLRITVPATGARVPSISDIYWCAFIYENEIHDLFRVQIDGIAVDYKGKFYRTTIPFPFSSRGQVASVTSSGATTSSTGATAAPASSGLPPSASTPNH